MTSTAATPESRRRKLFVLASELGLTRDERIELTQALLWREIVSWRHLTDDQVLRLLDALEGYEKISMLFRLRAE